jgi:hypothetical protein
MSCRPIVEKIASKVQSYDISFTNFERNPYGKLSMSNETALIARRSYANLIGKNDFDISSMIKKDPEINCIRPFDSQTFLRYYKLAYSEYKRKNYFKSQKYLKDAMRIRPNDLLCEYLFTNTNRATVITQSRVFIK